MADRDLILRIILEGRDKISGSLKPATKALSDLRRELKLTEDQITRQSGSRRGEGGVFISKDDVSQFAVNLGNMKRTLSRGLNDMGRDARSFRKEFSKGFNISRELEQDIGKALKDFQGFQNERIRQQDLYEDRFQKRVEEGLFRRRQAENQLIRELRRDKAEAEDAETKDAIAAEIERVQFRRDAFARETRERVRVRGRERKQDIRLETPVDVINAIRKESNDAAKDVDQLDGALARLGRRAGTNVGNIFRGFRLGRTATRELTDEIKKSEGVFTRFGIAVGDATRNMGRFINLRWLFITGIITLFFNLVVQLGAAIVALGASALKAAVALGGAFAAALAQLAPVAALAAAAMNRLGVVMDAVKLAEKNRIKSADDAKAAADKQRESSERLEDSQWNLKQAVEAVADAQFNQIKASKDVKDAFKEQAKAAKDLAEARKQAQRDIVDANLEERDSALALKEAELAVVDAKQKLREEEAKQRQSGQDISDAQAALREANERLKIARAQGDQAEISAAAGDVSIAEQNLSEINDKVAETQNNIQQAQTDVKRAEINREQAAIRAKRAREDAAESRKKGVEGSDIVLRAQEALKNATEGVADAQRQVILSNRAVRDSLHNLTVAQREVNDARRDAADATNTQTAAQKQLQEALADLSPSEKKLFNALKRIQGIFRKVFIGTGKKDGILGPINEGLTNIINTFSKLLLDPKIQKAALQLSTALGKALDKFANFIGTKEFRDDLIFFTEQATKNIPKVADALLNVFKIFLKIAREASPIFNRLLDRFLGATEKGKGFVNREPTRRRDEGDLRSGISATVEQSPLEKALSSAEKHLNSWIDLAKAIGRVIFFLTGGASASGKTLLDHITDKLNEWADWLRDNPQKVHDFFEKMRKSLENLSTVIGKFAGQFVKAFSSDEFTAFTQLMLEVVIPGVLLLIKFIGLLSKALLFLFEIPVVGNMLKWIAIFLAFERSLNKIFPVSQNLTNAIKKGLIFQLKILFAILTDPKRAIQAFANQLKLASYYVGLFIKNAKANILLAFSNAIKAVTIAVTFLKRAFIALLLTPPYIVAIIAGIIAAIILLDQKFHFIIPTIRFLGRIFRDVFDWIKKNWKLLVAILLAPFAVVAIAIFKWRDKIIGFIKFVFNWVQNNWKKLLIAALTAPFALGGFVIQAVIKFKGKIIGFFGDIVTGAKNLFKELFRWIRDKFTGAVDWVQKKWEGVKSFFGFGSKKLSPENENKINNEILADKSFDPIRKKIKDLRKKGLNGTEIIARLIEDGDVTEEQVKKLIKNKVFAAKGMVVPGSGNTDTVPAMLTPGEWVLNKGQQGKIASALKMSIDQTKAFVFGTNMGDKKRPGPHTTGTKPSKTKDITRFNKFNLVPQEDENGETVWFIELANGTFGQVTDRDAAKILATHGNFIPGYVKRSVAGFNVDKGGFRPFSLGGIVTPQVIRHFAQGGMVQNPGFGGTMRAGTKVEQNFNVTMQDEQDWSWVMRIAAMNAQQSF